MDNSQMHFLKSCHLIFLYSIDLAKLSVLITSLGVKTSCTRAPHVVSDSTSETFTTSRNKVKKVRRSSTSSQ